MIGKGENPAPRTEATREASRPIASVACATRSVLDIRITSVAPGKTACGAKGIRKAELQTGTRGDRPNELPLSGRELTLPRARIGEEVVIRQASFVRLLHAKRVGHESRFHLVVVEASEPE